jgi:hypothetical protein
MNAWARAVTLFHEIAAFDQAQAAQRREWERASEALGAWYVRAEELILNALHAEIERHVAELGPVGLPIRVTSPSAPPRLGPSGVSLRFLSIRLADEVVTAYATRQGAFSLTLHWAWQVQARSERFPRILSVPGIRVRPGPEQAIVLEAVVPGASKAQVALSDVAGEMLSMLAEAAASQRRLVPGRVRLDC